MTQLKTFLLGTALAGSTFMAASAALAAPITSQSSLTANGEVNAVFVYADASDTSALLEVGIGAVIFNNHVDAIGATKDIGFNSGPIEFTLENLSKGISFENDVADGNGNFHAKYGTSAADFGVAFSANANAAIAALVGPVLLVGFEDLDAAHGSDFDYNDLIFAFSAVRDPVPEPASLALLGVGLLGLGFTQLRRRNA